MLPTAHCQRVETVLSRTRVAPSTRSPTPLGSRSCAVIDACRDGRPILQHCGRASPAPDLILLRETWAGTFVKRCCHNPCPVSLHALCSICNLCHCTTCSRSIEMRMDAKVCSHAMSVMSQSARPASSGHPFNSRNYSSSTFVAGHTCETRRVRCALRSFAARARSPSEQHLFPRST